MSEQPGATPQPDPYQHAEAEAQEETQDEASTEPAEGAEVTEPGGEGTFDSATDLVTDGSAAHADVAGTQEDLSRDD